MAGGRSQIFSDPPDTTRPGSLRTSLPPAGRYSIRKENSGVSSRQYPCFFRPDGNIKRFHPGMTENRGTGMYSFSLFPIRPIHPAPNRFSPLEDIPAFHARAGYCFVPQTAVIGRMGFSAYCASETIETRSGECEESFVPTDGR